MMPVCAANGVPLSFDVAPWVPKITAHCGLHFGPTRIRRLQEALAQRMRVIGLNPQDYWQHLETESSGREWQALVDELVINETRFFRHKPSFELLQNTILPQRFQIAKNTGAGPVRMLSAGCANGAEAYSLAICALETPGRHQHPFEIEGIDISNTAIESARKGRFSARALKGLEQRHLQDYFLPKTQDNHYQVAPDVQRTTAFNLANLWSEQNPLRTDYDVIYCQNLLIYTDNQHRQNLLSLFARHLKPGGYVVLGPAEILRWHEPLLSKMDWEQTLVFQRAIPCNER